MMIINLLEILKSKKDHSASSPRSTISFAASHHPLNSRGVMDLEFFTYMLIGFAAQLVDGALGMAYGLTASSWLLATGLPPASVSATVHLAETFTTGASAVSHHHFGNIDRKLFRRLLIPALFGAVTGAWLISQISGDSIRPWIAGYVLIMGLVVVGKAFGRTPTTVLPTHVGPLGFGGALVDAIGGGGWGPIVASTLLARGNQARFTIGTVNAVEFFVTLIISLVFLMTLGSTHWSIVVPLALGGLLAAPMGAWLCRRVPTKPMMIAVGFLIVLVSLHTLYRALFAG
jgi:uncharacterized membrane protein YfcA